MKKLISIIIIGVLAVGVYTWFTGTKEGSPLVDKLTVGTSADFPPFSFRDETDAITGFDIDVIKEIARRMNITLDIQDKPFNTLIAQMQLGQIQTIAAGMTPTEERAKQVHFTKAYITSNPLVIVTRSNGPHITDLAGLKGKNVIVNAGYTADLYLTRHTEISLIRLPRVADALTALEQGKADAFVTASFTLFPYVKEGDTRFTISKIPHTDEQSALALSKRLSKNVIDNINRTLDAMEEDGTLTTLKQKWKVV